MKILLVDDSGTMRTIQKRSFLQIGIAEGDISEAENGAIGLELFKEGGFDFVVTDWNMPVMDGLAFLKEVRQIDANVPVIMVTTESERARVVTAIEAGVSDYLVKPFTPDQMKEKITKWVPAQV